MKTIIFDLCDMLACADGTQLDMDLTKLARTIETYRQRGFRTILTVPLIHQEADETGGSVPPDRLQKLLEQIGDLADRGLHFDNLSLSAPRTSRSDLIIDDKGVTLEEFVSLSHEEILDILDKEAARA